MAVSKRLRFEILRRDGFRCRYCGATPEQRELRIDHVLPVALGGGDAPDNLVTACDPCNSGKTSIAPDSPLVAAVSEDAIRWARAIQYVAMDRARDREGRQELHAKFLAKWNSWTFTRGIKTYTVDIPGGWQSSFDRFIDSGLELADLEELVDVAMAARTDDPWRYLCGCAWKRVRESHEKAREVMDDWDAYDENEGHS